jgi:hypothetical protein
MPTRARRRSLRLTSDRQQPVRLFGGSSSVETRDRQSSSLEARSCQSSLMRARIRQSLQRQPLLLLSPPIPQKSNVNPVLASRMLLVILGPVPSRRTRSRRIASSASFLSFLAQSTRERPIIHLPIYPTMTSEPSPTRFLILCHLYADLTDRLFLCGRLDAALPCGSSQARQRSPLGGAPRTGGPAPAANPLSP